MQATMFGRDIWIKYTQKDGTSYVSYHRAWDADRLVKSRNSEMAKLGGKAELTSKPN